MEEGEGDTLIIVTVNQALGSQPWMIFGSLEERQKRAALVAYITLVSTGNSYTGVVCSSTKVKYNGTMQLKNGLVQMIPSYEYHHIHHV